MFFGVKNGKSIFSKRLLQIRLCRHYSKIQSSNSIKLSQPETRRQKLEKKEARRKEYIHNLRLKQEKQSKKNEYEYIGKSNDGDKKDVGIPLPKTYSPQFVEAAWYSWWEKAGHFQPDKENNAEKFIMVLPPPNITGNLHIGHALGCSIQDALCRWHRMHGHNVLWVPGCDHAGIATQVVVEKDLWSKLKKTRHDLGREAFLEEVWKWKDEKGSTIYDQIRKLGCSLDWSKECFTLDKKLQKAVNEAFIRLHEEGLIYRNEQLVNWSCALKSSISDIEVDKLPLEGKTALDVPGYDKKVDFGLIYSFSYRVYDTDEEISVSTTRPETMLGDAAVAVHPDDPRFSHLHGKHVRHPFTGENLPIVLDNEVDMEFGTGAVKITPGHDFDDFNLGQRHNLKAKTIISDDGLMINVPEKFLNLQRFVARKHVINCLASEELFHGVKEHEMVLPVCSRSGDIVEPLIKYQWFLDCKEMAKKAIESVKSGNLQLKPDNYEAVWFEWLNNIRDWCISRQLWWGHRIPVYKITCKSEAKCENNVPEWISAHSREEALEKLNEITRSSDFIIEQDEDVLDTWFSSALFPFSVFGWPENSDDLSQFYPTSILETGSDILFFWVARMVMMGEKLTNKLPFETVLMHGILRDRHGRKMSKSSGNVIDPMDIINGKTLLELEARLDPSKLSKSEIKTAAKGLRKDFPLGIEACGADALRFSLCSLKSNSHFVNIDMVHIRSTRLFCNKIWQAFTFCNQHLNTSSFKPEDINPIQVLHFGGKLDLWILSRLSHLTAECDSSFRDHTLYIACQALYNFFWHDFCDIYLEYCKPILRSSDSCETKHKEIVLQVLHLVIGSYLKAIAPFMPFLSEELYQRLPCLSEFDSIHKEVYPLFDQMNWRDPETESDMEFVKEVVHCSSTIQEDFSLPKSTRVKAILECHNESFANKLQLYARALSTLTRSESFQICKSSEMNEHDKLPTSIFSLPVNESCFLHVDLKDKVNIPTTLAKLEKTKSALSERITENENKRSQRRRIDTAITKLKMLLSNSL